MAMMSYKVVITPKAKGQITDIFDYITCELHSPGAAKKLFDRMMQAIQSLDTFPKRFAALDLEEAYPEEIRRVMVKNYSIFYTIQEEETVVVLSVLYSASDFKTKFLGNRGRD